jgi:hypothetical protein
MSEISNYLENALINGTLRATTYTAPTTIYVALYLTDPTDADSGTEVSGASYVRQSVAFSAPSNGVTSNSAAVEFPQATTTWGTVAYIGLRDASTAGNLLYHSPLDVSKLIETADIFKINIGSLTVTLS